MATRYEQKWENVMTVTPVATGAHLVGSVSLRNGPGRFAPEEIDLLLRIHADCSQPLN